MYNSTNGCSVAVSVTISVTVAVIAAFIAPVIVPVKTASEHVPIVPADVDLLVLHERPWRAIREVLHDREHLRLPREVHLSTYLSKAFHLSPWMYLCRVVLPHRVLSGHAEEDAVLGGQSNRHAAQKSCAGRNCSRRTTLHVKMQPLLANEQVQG